MKRQKERNCIENDVLRMIRLGSIVLLLGSFLRTFWFNDSSWVAALVLSIVFIVLLPTKVSHKEDKYEV